MLFVPIHENPKVRDDNAQKQGLYNSINAQLVLSGKWFAWHSMSAFSSARSIASDTAAATFQQEGQVGVRHDQTRETEANNDEQQGEEQQSQTTRAPPPAVAAVSSQ